MARTNRVTYSQFLQEYRHDIFQMLLSMGAERSAAAALMDEYRQDIESWAGHRPEAGSIVTAQMAARMLVRVSDLDIDDGL